jgi:hypothetical protein
MKRILPIVAAFLAGSVAAVAGGEYGDRYDGGGHGSIYDRIHAHYAHYGRDVRESFRDGPCEIERHWERDGDFEEHIECEGPGD